MQSGSNHASLNLPSSSCHVTRWQSFRQVLPAQICFLRVRAAPTNLLWSYFQLFHTYSPLVSRYRRRSSSSAHEPLRPVFSGPFSDSSARAPLGFRDTGANLVLLGTSHSDEHFLVLSLAFLCLYASSFAICHKSASSVHKPR